MPDSSFKRTRLWIDRPMQTRIVRDSVLPPLAALVGGSLIVFFMLKAARAEADIREIDMPSLGNLEFALLVFSGMCGMVILYHALVMSHRVAGPLVRVQTTLDRREQGEEGVRVQLRDRDYLHSYAEQVNQLLRQLDAKDAELDQLRGQQADATDPATSEPQAADTSQ